MYYFADFALCFGRISVTSCKKLPDNDPCFCYSFSAVAFKMEAWHKLHMIGCSWMLTASSLFVTCVSMTRTASHQCSVGKKWPWDYSILLLIFEALYEQIQRWTGLMYGKVWIHDSSHPQYYLFHYVSVQHQQSTLYSTLVPNTS